MKMQILHCSSLPIPSLVPPPPPQCKTLIFASVTLRPHRNYLTSSALRCSNSPPTTEQELLDAIAGADGDQVLPCVRTYEDELARLTVIGAVDFEQALTAAAADGGGAAAEHVDAGMDAMVVETVFPGPPEHRSTTSTRLFLPARKVKEKARKLRRSLSEEMLSGTTSRNILAMTFRQVVLQQLWSFQLVGFRPGTLRSMEDLESPREVTASFALSSSDYRVISVLAEALCSFALESTKDHFRDTSHGRSSKNFFRWSRRPKEVSSRDSSVMIDKLSEDEIFENASNLVKNFKSAKNNIKQFNLKGRNLGWTPSTQRKLENIGGPEFGAWLCEYLPVYRLQIDSGRLEDLKLEGWKQLSENTWEILLSHFQMVALTNVFDMFYEDNYTLPAKEIPCNMVVDPVSNTKRLPLVQMLTIAFAGGVLIAAIRIFNRSHLPWLENLLKCQREHKALPSSSETLS